MKTVTVYRRDGSEAGAVDLPEDIFGVEPSMDVLYQVIKAYLANKRQGNASTKSRSEIKASKSKPYRQKGTGRARAGSANSPIWVGGGVAFGPKPRSFRQKVNQKVRRQALKSAYSIKAAEDKIKVIEDFSLEAPKTRDIADMLRALGIENEKTVFLFGGKDENLYKSSRNIPSLHVKMAENAHTYEIMNSDMLLFMKSALDKVQEIFRGSEATK